MENERSGEADGGAKGEMGGTRNNAISWSVNRGKKEGIPVSGDHGEEIYVAPD